jgi:CheY-like chemotaxis protein
MINDVLDLTRMEGGHLTLHREQVKLQEIIENSISVVHPILDKKQLTIRTRIPDDLPEIYCDHTRIQQVILNLLSNAARITRQGGITIEAVQQEQDVMVTVTDTGPGIPPEDVERIFEPFWQGTDNLWRENGTSGLGLSISKQFVKLHDGKMWLESDLGKGTTFFFTLPISAPLNHTASPSRWVKEDWDMRENSFIFARDGYSRQLYKPRIIICDNIGALAAEFEHYTDEVEFIATQNLVEVVQELEEGPAQAVIINTLDPAEAWLLASVITKKAPNTPIIGCSVPQPVEKALEAGALGHLIKPVKYADLEAAIQAVDKPVKQILLVDDDPEVLSLFSRMLRIHNGDLEIDTASNGQQALEKLQNVCPDLLLLDIVMPDMDGWQLLAHMAQDEALEQIPTFLVSAQDPTDRPLASKFMLVTMDGGLDLNKFLRFSLEIPPFLLKPGGQLDLIPEQTV